MFEEPREEVRLIQGVFALYIQGYCFEQKISMPISNLNSLKEFLLQYLQMHFMKII